MRRTVATAVLVVGVGLVLAAPEVRRSIGSRAAAAVETVRSRVREFRTDYATREAELRAQLLPTEDEQDAAARHRAAH